MIIIVADVEINDIQQTMSILIHGMRKLIKNVITRFVPSIVEAL